MLDITLKLLDQLQALIELVDSVLVVPLFRLELVFEPVDLLQASYLSLQDFHGLLLGKCIQLRHQFIRVCPSNLVPDDVSLIDVVGPNDLQLVHDLLEWILGLVAFSCSSCGASFHFPLGVCL